MILDYELILLVLSSRENGEEVAGYGGQGLALQACSAYFTLLIISRPTIESTTTTASRASSPTGGSRCLAPGPARIAAGRHGAGTRALLEERLWMAMPET